MVSTQIHVHRMDIEGCSRKEIQRMRKIQKSLRRALLEKEKENLENIYLFFFFRKRATYLETRSRTHRERGGDEGGGKLTGVGGQPTGGGLRGGRLRRPGCLLLAAGSAAGSAHRALGTPGHVRVAHHGPQTRHGARGHRRARARRKQRGGRRVRVGLEVEGRYPHVLQGHPPSRLHQTGCALASAYGSCKFAPCI